MFYYYYLRLAVGTLYIVTTEERVVYISLTSKEEKFVFEYLKKRYGKMKQEKNRMIENTLIQISDYLKKNREVFELPIYLEGTEFQKKVWTELLEIPYGETVSYKDIAIRIGKPKGARAIGQAINKNPIGIIVPCHRVIGSNNNLTGYAGGLDIKEYLLNLERLKN
jgi:methylated-DNA-[protein]-cysteine S-methyltransferase